ncbi:MAG: uncharacterized protein HW412_2231 [Bacteroidetes bacterium]|nr:uncharacterized protein [Bacteroidota bacterium]
MRNLRSILLTCLISVLLAVTAHSQWVQTNTPLGFADASMQEEQMAGTSHFLGASLDAGSKATSILDQVPDAFIENRGQWVPSAKFATRRSGLAAWFTGNSIGLILSSQGGQSHSALVWLEFERSAEDVTLEGESVQPTYYNFYLGNDPARWQSRVPSYSSILHRGLYQGVDVRVKNADRFLEYDLLLAPGVDPSGIVIRAEGITDMHVDDDGSLVMETRAGTITQRVPTSWYVMPDGSTEPVRCSYRILDDRRFTFEVKQWSPLFALVIDPAFIWTTYAGGSGTETPAGIAVAATGFVYCAVTTSSMDFPVTPGALDSTRDGPSDIAFFVLDPNRTGNAQLVYGTYLGGSGEDNARVLSLEALGFVVVGGASNSLNYPIIFNAFDSTHNGGLDITVSRFDSLGRLRYSTYIGGALDDIPNAAVEGQKNQSTFVGSTRSTNFPTTVDAFDRTANGQFDAFALRLDYSLVGNAQLTWSTFLGGLLNDFANDVAEDSAHKPTIVGITHSSNFPVKLGFDLTYNGNGDAFLAKLDPTESDSAQLRNSTFFGGSQHDEITGIAAFVLFGTLPVVTGYTLSSNLPTTPGAFDQTYNGGFDAFVAKFGADLVNLITSTFLGGTFDEFSGGIVVTPDDDMVVVGKTASTNFPIVRGDSVRRGPTDGYVATVAPAGHLLWFSTLFGGSGTEEILDAGYLFRRRSDGATGIPVYILGQTTSSDLPTTPGAFQTMLRGPSDVFVASLLSIPTSVREGREDVLPLEFALHQNFPNPFNPSSTIKFQIPRSSHVILRIYDVLGKEIATLVNEPLIPGSYEKTFDGSGLASGMYFYRMQAGTFVETRKLVLLK